jgi:endonuclease III related protein
MTNNLGEDIRLIYTKLYNLYGPQGWWPLINHKGSNPTKTGATRGYHPLNYDLPESRNDIYEIMLGSILTQNTTWTSAEKALLNLNHITGLIPEKLLDLSDNNLKDAIRCAGFLNQKASYLREITKFYISLKGNIPTRDELLMVRGVGNETADSILLYGYKQPEFVVDAYTKRIFIHQGIIKDEDNYCKIKKLFQSVLTPDHVIYNEYHALIVEHAKKYYTKKPYGEGDPIL